MSDDRALFATTAALLDQGRSIDRVAWGLTVAALVALAVAPESLGHAVLAAAAAIGFIEAYLAARVAFDAALFRALGQGQGLADLGAMDRALQALRLIPAAKAGRPAAARVAGARRLMRWQATALGAQVVVLGLGILLR